MLFLHSQAFSQEGYGIPPASLPIGFREAMRTPCNRDSFGNAVSLQQELSILGKIRRVAKRNGGDFVFYDKYCELCARKGIAPTKAAIDMGMAKSLPTAWKNRGITPRAAQLDKIASYFGVTVDELLGTKKEPVQTDRLTDEEQRLINAYRNADAKRRELAEIALKS